jgi:hypothetical protein
MGCVLSKFKTPSNKKSLKSPLLKEKNMGNVKDSPKIVIIAQENLTPETIFVNRNCRRIVHKAFISRNFGNPKPIFMEYLHSIDERRQITFQDYVDGSDDEYSVSSWSEETLCTEEDRLLIENFGDFDVEITGELPPLLNI